MAKPTILLICSEGNARDAYLAELAGLDVTLVVERDCSSFLAHYADEKLAGVLVDVPTQARSPKEDKLIVNEMVDAYPALRVRWDEASKTISTLYFGQRRGVSISIASFVTEQCATFAPRVFRVVDRRPLTVPVRVSRTPELGDQAVRTVTINVAPGGAFLFGVDVWAMGEQLWLAFDGLAEHIQAEVCWVLPWGTPRTMPGVGVRFLEPSEERYRQLCAIGRFV